MVNVFRLVRDCLTDDGTLWLNIGDSYYNYRKDGCIPKQTFSGNRQDLPETTPRRSNKLVGYKDKDLIIVDKSLTAMPGNIIIAMIDGEFTIKRLSIKNNELYLKSENHNYPDFRFKNHIDVQICGVVIYSIHSYL